MLNYFQGSDGAIEQDEIIHVYRRESSFASDDLFLRGNSTLKGPERTALKRSLERFVSAETGTCSQAFVPQGDGTFSISDYACTPKEQVADFTNLNLSTAADRRYLQAVIDDTNPLLTIFKVRPSSQPEAEAHNALVNKVCSVRDDKGFGFLVIEERNQSE